MIETALLRIDALRQQLSNEGCQAALISKLEHVRYLSGFSGSSGALLVFEDGQHLVTDFRYEEQAAGESPHCELVIAKDGMIPRVKELATERASGSRIAFQSAILSYKDFATLTADTNGIEWVPISGLVDPQAAIKDQHEIELIAKAQEITDAVLLEVVDRIRVGMTEREVGAEIDYQARLRGAESTCFGTIVASGKRAALPHGVATEKIVESGEMVTIDFGVFYEGYASDLTRTISMGPPSDKLVEVHDIVGRAQDAALEMAGESVAASDLDECAREVIHDAGYGDAFGHSLGHGVGLNVHEDPRISAKSEQILKNGMVITIEPGIYLPGWGGVRTEDLIVITGKTHRNLTTTPKELMIVDH